MACFAPPVQRDHFVYQDVLYIDVGNANRHKRATIPELTALLRPAKNTTALKDEVGHYFEAQLIHYGLAPSKNKAVAKVRLLEALNKGSLKVPDGVAHVEKELKKEWDTANRKAKKAFQDGQDTSGFTPVTKPPTKKATSTKKETTSTAKRRADDEVTAPAKKQKTTAVPKADAADQNTATPKASKAKATTTPKVVPKPETAPKKTTKAATSTTTDTVSATKTTVVKTEKSKKSSTTSQVKVEKDTELPKPSATPSKQTASRGGASTGAGRGGKQTSTTLPSSLSAATDNTVNSSSGQAQTPSSQPRTKQTARRGTFSGSLQRPSQSLRQDIDSINSHQQHSYPAALDGIYPRGIKQEDPRYVKQEDEIYDSNNYNGPQDPLESSLFISYNGIYSITSPQISLHHPTSIPANGLKLKLLYSPRTNTIWPLTSAPSTASSLPLLQSPEMAAKAYTRRLSGAAEMSTDSGICRRRRRRGG